MKTKTLYNEYRPQSFVEVVGQDVPVKTMTHALENKNIASAYLLSGSRGIGKTTCARIFARGILCTSDDENKKGADGCGECEACKAFDEGLSSDFIEIDAATNRGIDNIREIKDQIYMAPVMGDRKVVLIDEVHHLTNEAATALLKILEEPPSGVVFLLATTDPQKIPATIRSRCQWLRFRPLELRQIEDRLSYVLGREGISAEDGVSRMIAKRADGGLRDALSMLDMMITYVNSDRISLKDAEISLGVVSRDIIDRLVSYITDNNLAYAIGFTVRNRTSDVSAYDLMCSLHDFMSEALIMISCGEDALYALEGASSTDIEIARKLTSLGKEKLLFDLDVIERNLWKFDSSALDDDHIFNEIIISIMDPKLDPKHLSLDETDRNIISNMNEKTATISKAVSTLAKLQKKSIETLDEIKRSKKLSNN